MGWTSRSFPDLDPLSTQNLGSEGPQLYVLPGIIAKNLPGVSFGPWDASSARPSDGSTSLDLDLRRIVSRTERMSVPRQAGHSLESSPFLMAALDHEPLAQDTLWFIL